MPRTTQGRLMVLAVVLGALLVALPASSAGPKEKRLTGGKQLTHFSQAVALRFWAENPAFAPKQFTERLQHVRSEKHPGKDRKNRGTGGAAGIVFNADEFGLPQNEESVSACRSNTRYVLEGTNDYRGLLDPAGNFTGWHFSNDGGRSLTNEGLLPPVPLLSDPDTEVPSGGDPVMVAGGGCALFGGGLAFDAEDPLSNPNGIQVAKSAPSVLASCDTTDPANPDCWPVRRLVAEGTGVPDPTPANPGHFLDKPWFDVGWSGDAEYVWVAYSDFAITGPGDLDFTAEIFAVRCTSDLAECTEPIPISEDDVDVQFADVTIGPDGRVYVTWSQIFGELTDEPQTFVQKLRVAEPGSTTFGPEKVVAVEDLAIPFGGNLNANDFRIATLPKNTVALHHGEPRIFVVWDACRYRPLDTVCEDSYIKLTWSDDFGDSWAGPVELSRGGNNYFPSVDWNDRTRKGDLAFTWFSNRRDRQFDNRQDVEFATVGVDRPWKVEHRRVLTRGMNESESDPLLGGFFIGDYIEVSAVGSRAWVAYNANYRQQELLGEGVPVPQQDNYLDAVRFGR
jgi:hypothetical protein